MWQSTTAWQVLQIASWSLSRGDWLNLNQDTSRQSGFSFPWQMAISQRADTEKCYRSFLEIPIFSKVWEIFFFLTRWNFYKRRLWKFPSFCDSSVIPAEWVAHRSFSAIRLKAWSTAEQPLWREGGKSENLFMLSLFPRVKFCWQQQLGKWFSSL